MPKEPTFAERRLTFCKSCAHELVWGDTACLQCGARQSASWLTRTIIYSGLAVFCIGAIGVLKSGYSVVRALLQTSNADITTTAGQLERVGMSAVTSVLWLLLGLWCVTFASGGLLYAAGRALERWERFPVKPPAPAQ